MREYKPLPKTVRCAIYTRKSTDEGLEQEFNSLDAQREAGEAYVHSQRHEGWVVIPELYDDGGFSGGNLDRPALRRLLRDIQDRKVDVVLVYKVDRLSRSLTDFSKILELFDKYGVAFLSITQQFNTTSSMGRLTLNILLSFAQFEREIISERTRDKMSAARRKGKFVGGLAVLGYDVTPQKKLEVNPEEAERVRTIFDLYLQRRSLLETAQELNRRGWKTKRWVTKNGKERGGLVWDRNNLRQLLINPSYIGKLVFKGEVYDAEHDAIVEESVWQRVQCQLERNARSGGSEVRNEFGALLKGKLRCAACSCAMTPSHSTRNGKRFRYYRCDKAMKQGKHVCPTRSIPAGEIEAFVVGQIKKLASDPDLITDTISAARRQVQMEIHNAEQELTSLQRDLAHWNAEVGRLAAHVGPTDVETPTTRRLAELHDRIRVAERRGPELREELRELQTRLLDEAEVRVALQQFDPVWKSLTPAEQTRVVDLLVESVSYDGNAGKIAVTFHPAGLQAFTNEFINQETNHMNEPFTIEAEIHFARKGRGYRRVLRTGPAPEIPLGRLPRITRLMALAIHFEELIRTGEVKDYAELATAGQVTRARITQIMNLTLLAPDIQEAVLFMPRVQRGRDPVHILQVQAVCLTPDWEKQRSLWQRLLFEK